MQANEVGTAFKILLEELGTVIADLNKAGADAFQSRNYEDAQAIADLARQVDGLYAKVLNLQKEWKHMLGKLSTNPKARKGNGQSVEAPKRLQRGLRTPEAAFRVPILQTLTELGGSASAGDVLQRVYDKVKHLLNEYDLQSLPSNPAEPRWRKTAQWCRYSMVKDGLLASDSPIGIWEITEKGRAELARSKQGAG